MKKSFSLFGKQHPIFTLIIIGFVFSLFRMLPFIWGKTLLFGDNYSLMVPGKLFTSEWIAQGILPLWNPTIFAGIPWIGDINQSLLYPSTILFMLLPAAVALNSTVLFHLTFTFVGAALLAKKNGVKSMYLLLAMAVLWSFSPQVIGSLNNISTMQSIAWMPWVVLLGQQISRRSYAFYFILAVFFQLLGGYPQHVLYSVLTAVAFSLFSERKTLFQDKNWWLWIVQWTVVGSGVLGICAVVVFPFVMTLLESSRTVQSVDQAAAGSLEFFELLKIVIPHVFDDASQGIKWGPSWNKPPNVMVYFTWFGLFAAAAFIWIKKKTSFDWFLISLSVGSVLLALGDNFPLFALLQNITLFKFSRGLSTVLMVTTLVGSLWLVKVMERIEVSGKYLRFLYVGLPIGIIFLGVGGLLSLQNFDEVWKFIDSVTSQKLSSSPFHTIERDLLLVKMILSAVVINACLLVVAVWAWQHKKLSVWLLILFVDLTYNMRGHLFFAPNQVYDSQRPPALRQAFENADMSQYRVLTRNYNTPYTDFGAYWDALAVRAPFSDSYVDEAELREFNHLQRMRQAATPNWNMVYGIPIINGYTTLLPQSMQTVFAADVEGASINNLPIIVTTNLLLREWAVKYYLVDEWFPTYDEVFPSKVSGSGTGLTVYELDGTLARFRFENGTALLASEYSENPNKVMLNFENRGNQSFLVMADRYDPRWRARVNGKTVQIEDFNSMRRLAIENGPNSVVIEYVPIEFYWGAAISLVTLLAVLLFHKKWLFSSLFK